MTKEQTAFVATKHKSGSEPGQPPWTGVANEDELKTKIIALSADKRNVLRDPPGGAQQFRFVFDEYNPVALAMLQEDPRLSDLRFELVPKKSVYP